MACLFDYLNWRGDLSFKISPFNTVDNIIFSQLTYLSLDDIVSAPGEGDGISIALAVRAYDEKIKSDKNFKLTSVFKEDPDLIRALGASRRFGNCHLFGYVNRFDAELELQFSALCIYTDDNHCFVAYRGTDSSLVGWKEDFNMCFMDVIPSQIEAVKYIELMAPTIQGPLRIGGHSKGGNLAIYAASQCDRKIQKRITGVYCNDAPGFHEKFISSEGYSEIKNKIHAYVPQSSVIGMFMEHGNKYKVIKSSESGIFQHCLYSWDVTHNDLVYYEKSTASSRFINKIIRDWIDNHDNAEREQFIEALYHIFKAANVKSISELENSWFSVAGRVLKSLKNADESTKKFIKKTLMELFRSAGRNIETLFKSKLH
jgi:hypothetical protein